MAPKKIQRHVLGEIFKFLGFWNSISYLLREDFGYRHTRRKPKSGNKNYCPVNNFKERHVAHEHIRIFRKYFNENVSSLHKQQHQNKICLQKFLGLNNLYDYKNRHEWREKLRQHFPFRKVGKKKNPEFYGAGCLLIGWQDYKLG